MQQSIAGSVADSAQTDVKATVAMNKKDFQYVYKKTDNMVVLILKMELPQEFFHDKQDLYFGFQMTTKSLRYQQDPFTMTVPVLINCGKATVKNKEEAPSASTQKTGQQQ